MRITRLFFFAAAAVFALAAAAHVFYRAPQQADDGTMRAPVAVTQRADELAALLSAAPFVPGNGGARVLYTVGFRSCPDCIALKKAMYERFAAAGVDVRKIVYARADRDGKPRSKPGERAMVAEIALTRDPALYERWFVTDPDAFYATEKLPPAADGDAARMALVDAGRALVEQLSGICEANGVDMAVPALFWQEDGVWQVYVGFEPQRFEAVAARIAGRPVP